MTDEVIDLDARRAARAVEPSADPATAGTIPQFAGHEFVVALKVYDKLDGFPMVLIDAYQGPDESRAGKLRRMARYLLAAAACIDRMSLVVEAEEAGFVPPTA